MVEARIGCAVRASFCGISRILFPLSRDGDHLSHSVSRAPSTIIGFSGPLPPSLKPDNSAGCDYYPRAFSRFRGKSGQATLPLLCLAPHGVFRAAPLTRMPGGLLPRLFTLTPLHFQVFLQIRSNPWPGLKVERGGIFSVTLSVTRDSRPGRPRFHGACCLPVFGLSSGKTSIKPAITRHRRG